jgi:hypothetical protein
MRRHCGGRRQQPHGIIVKAHRFPQLPESQESFARTGWTGQDEH